jgi:hypothetical protein
VVVGWGGVDYWGRLLCVGGTPVDAGTYTATVGACAAVNLRLLPRLCCVYVQAVKALLAKGASAAVLNKCVAAAAATAAAACFMIRAPTQCWQQ